MSLSYRLKKSILFTIISILLSPPAAPSVGNFHFDHFDIKNSLLLELQSRDWIINKFKLLGRCQGIFMQEKLIVVFNNQPKD